MVLLLCIPPLSLAGIAASAVARDRSRRWVYGVLGWLGWLVSVAAAMLVALVFMAGWGSSAAFSGGELALWLGSGAVAPLLPVLASHCLMSRQGQTTGRP